jgi:hypothetical protein
MSKIFGEPNEIGVVSKNNSTAVALGAGGIFTGIVDKDVHQYSQLTLYVYSDVDSATDGLEMQFSSDGVNFDRIKALSVNAGGSAHTLVLISQYFRIKYTNGATPQSEFRLQLIYHKYKSKELTSRLDQTLNDNVDVQNTRSIIVAKDSFGNYTNVSSNEYGQLAVNASNTTIFGENIAIPHNIIIQSYAPYGMINSQIYNQITATGGTITANTNGTEIDLAITTSIGSYAVLRSKKVIKYRPGFANQVRMSARFDSQTVANSLQFVGLGNANSDLYFCHNGTSFGIRRSTDGLAEVRSLQITTASAGAETITLTLNDVEYTINATNAGGVESFTAHEIEIANTYTGWNVDHIGDTLVFQARDVGPKTGTFSISSTGTADGTFSTNKTGSALTTTFVPQSSWNGYSTMVSDLDHTKNNLYEIEYSWFGSSDIYFRVYKPSTSRFETVHVLSFANTDTDPSLSAPNMFIQVGVASLGSTTAMTLVTTCSMGSTLGPILINKPNHSVSTSQAISSSTETNLLVLKNVNVVNGFSNQSEIVMRLINIASDGNRPVRISIVKNPTSLGDGTTSDYSNYSYVDQANSLALVDYTSITYTGGELISTYYVGKNGLVTLEYDKELVLSQRDELLITAFSTATNTVDISCSFVDDI